MVLARLCMYGAVVDVIPLRGLFSIMMKTICVEKGVFVALTVWILATDNAPRSIITSVKIANTLFLRLSLRRVKQTSL